MSVNAVDADWNRFSQPPPVNVIESFYDVGTGFYFISRSNGILKEKKNIIHFTVGRFFKHLRIRTGDG